MISKDSFCKNIKKQESAMYALAVSIVKNDADAAEVLSEAIFRAYSHLDTLKNQAAFRSWILKIVHHTAVDLIRQNSKYTELNDTSPAEEKGVDLTTKLALREAVAALQQPYRTVVVLYYYENLSASQIAEITESSQEAVRQQLSRARKMLRELLKEDFVHA